MDYALDLKNFHETSHICPIVPILDFDKCQYPIHLPSKLTRMNVYEPLKANAYDIGKLFKDLSLHNSEYPN